jgi:tRNA-binding EMAP/Myf-like protein
MNEQNRKVCVLCNLKPVVMRGIKSDAMVLAASNEDHTRVRHTIPSHIFTLKKNTHSEIGSALSIYHNAVQKLF